MTENPSFELTQMADHLAHDYDCDCEACDESEKYLDAARVRVVRQVVANGPAAVARRAKPLPVVRQAESAGTEETCETCGHERYRHRPDCGKVIDSSRGKYCQCKAFHNQQAPLSDAKGKPCRRRVAQGKEGRAQRVTAHGSRRPTGRQYTASPRSEA